MPIVVLEMSFVLCPVVPSVQSFTRFFIILVVSLVHIPFFVIPNTLTVTKSANKLTHEYCNS